MRFHTNKGLINNYCCVICTFLVISAFFFSFNQSSAWAKVYGADEVDNFNTFTTTQVQTMASNINSHYILFGHNSVGRCILGDYEGFSSSTNHGLEVLEQAHGFTINGTTDNSTVTTKGLHDFHVGSNEDVSSKLNGFVNEVKTRFNNGANVNCAFYKLCYIDVGNWGSNQINGSNYQTFFNAYVSEIKKLRDDSKYSNVVFVHCTIPLMVSGNTQSNAWRIQYNNLITNEYNKSADFIFDIADIECTDNNVAKTKYSYLLNKYAYDTNDSHLSLLGCERLAKVLMILLNDVCNGVVPATKPTADFSAAKASVSTNETVTFANSSTGSYTSCSWNFGDNTVSSATTNTVTHKYEQAGIYTVVLTVSNSAGSNTMTRINYITVQNNTVPPGQTVTKIWGENATDDYNKVTKDSLVISYVDSSETNRVWVRQSSLQYGVIYFDLSAIAGATVTKAELTLKTYYNWSTTNSVDLYAIEDPDKKGMWNESAVTTGYRDDNQKIAWSNTVPANVLNVLSAQKAGTITLQEDNAKLTVDITNVVSQWVSGARVNQGLFIQPPAGINVQFYSRETAGMANNGDFQPEAPSLKITYSSGTTPGNNAPVANAGVDQTVNEGVMVTLDGSKSSDQDTGDTLTYSWKQTAGTTVSLNSSSVVKPTFTAPSVSSQTTLTFELTVTDNHQAGSKDTVKIIVENILETKPNPKPDPEPEPKPKPDPQPNPQPDPQPDPEPEVEPHTVWYLAEGTTKSPFNEWILIQNPGGYEAVVEVTYMPDTGDNVVKEYQVGAGRRFSIYVNEIAELKDKDVSAKIAADTGIVVERAMYCAVGGHASIGVTQPATTWYLAEGTVKPPFHEWILIQNPGTAETVVWVTYMPDQGENITKEYLVKATSRYTIHVNDIVELTGKDVSAKVESANRIIVERAMYWDQGTHASIGVSQPAYSWYLAEGTVKLPFDEWILIQNPGTYDAAVQVTYMPDSGGMVTKDYIVEMKSRYSIHVNDIAELQGKDVSARVDADVEIIVERAMYCDVGGHASIGVSEPATSWCLAEGTTRDPFHEWILIQNPGSVDASVRVSFMPDRGDIVRKDYTVKARSRYTIHVNDIEELKDKDVSARIEANTDIIVERAMYWPEGAHGTIGVQETK